MYVIIGATGNTGRVISELLLNDGKKVRAVGRNPDRLKPLQDLGAEAAVGSVDDAGFLTETFSGASGVYAMIQPDYQAEDVRAQQRKTGEAIVSAIT